MKQSERIKELEERIEALEAPGREAEERQQQELERDKRERVEAKRRVARFREEQQEREAREQEARAEIARRAAGGLTANARGPAAKLPGEPRLSEEDAAEFRGRHSLPDDAPVTLGDLRDEGREAWAPPQPPIEAEVTAEAVAARDAGRS